MSNHKVNLIYDSSREGAAVGVRFGRSADRTLLFQAEPFSVDLVVHRDSDQLRYFHGQVVREALGAPVVGACVRLEESGDSVLTDEFGQFAVSSMAAVQSHVLEIGTECESIVLNVPPAEETEEF
jgi:hypothetical protein